MQTICPRERESIQYRFIPVGAHEWILHISRLQQPAHVHQFLLLDELHGNEHGLQVLGHIQGLQWWQWIWWHLRSSLVIVILKEESKQHGRSLVIITGYSQVNNLFLPKNMKKLYEMWIQNENILSWGHFNLVTLIRENMAIFSGRSAVGDNRHSNNG